MYQGLMPHIDTLNLCIMRSRTAAEGDWCFNQYKTNIETQFKPKLKNILLEYWTMIKNKQKTCLLVIILINGTDELGADSFICCEVDLLP